MDEARRAEQKEGHNEKKPSRADEKSGGNIEEVQGRDTELLPLAYHKCDLRGLQQHDLGHKAQGKRSSYLRRLFLHDLPCRRQTETGLCKHVTIMGVEPSLCRK